MALVLYLPASGVDEVKLESAELGTLAAVGASAEAVLRGVADARVAHAQGTMDKDLELQFGRSLVYLGYLVERQLASQHYSGETQRLQPQSLLCRSRVALGRGVYRQSHPSHQTHVLQQQGVHSCLAQLLCERQRVVHLAVVDDGVERDIDLGVKAMRILTQPADVVDRVAGCSAGAEACGTDIHGIGSAVDGCDATFQVLGGSQQFEFSHTFMFSSAS